MPKSVLRKFICVWTCFIVCGAFALEHPDIEPDHRPLVLRPPEQFDPKEPIDDRQLYRILEARGQELVASGKTLSTWKDKLAPRTVALELPEQPQEIVKLNPSQIFQSAEAGVVVIGVMYKCDKCPRNHVATASGFVLTHAGAVATNLHVLSSYNANGSGVVVMTRDGRVWPVKDILAVDPANDLMVLQMDVSDAGEKPVAYTPIFLGDVASAGSPVTLISHPAQHFYFATTGVAARYFRRGPVKFLNITADYAKGSSGAPVLDERALVVGLVRSTDSISYDATQTARDTHQMVIHNCAPVDALRKLVTTPYVEIPKTETVKIEPAAALEPPKAVNKAVE